MTEQVLRKDNTPLDGQQPAHLRVGKSQLLASEKCAVERRNSNTLNVVVETSEKSHRTLGPALRS
jgi:hypothetical protein